mmetsp:Transcript_29616/g.77689  ORF Transcript_29616/g.77689 Transcript_29616/m.77689 type:complete len:220 (+) Transcript_29616:876-1535(+)
MPLTTTVLWRTYGRAAETFDRTAPRTPSAAATARRPCTAKTVPCAQHDLPSPSWKRNRDLPPRNYVWRMALSDGCVAACICGNGLCHHTPSAIRRHAMLGSMGVRQVPLQGSHCTAAPPSSPRDSRGHDKSALNGARLPKCALRLAVPSRTLPVMKKCSSRDYVCEALLSFENHRPNSSSDAEQKIDKPSRGSSREKHSSLPSAPSSSSITMSSWTPCI